MAASLLPLFSFSSTSVLESVPESVKKRNEKIYALKKRNCALGVGEGLDLVPVRDDVTSKGGSSALLSPSLLLLMTECLSPPNIFYTA